MKKLLSILLMLIGFSFLVCAQGNINPQGKPFLEYNASIAGKSGGTITKDEILNAKTLILDSAVRSKYHIILFKLTIVCKGRDLVEFENHINGELTSAMTDELKKVIPGCELFIEYIQAVDSSNSTESKRMVRPMKFTFN